MERLAEQISSINITPEEGEASTSAAASKKVRKRRSRRKPKAKNVQEEAQEVQDIPFLVMVKSSGGSGFYIKKRISSETKRINLQTQNGPIVYETSSSVLPKKTIKIKNETPSVITNKIIATVSSTNTVQSNSPSGSPKRTRVRNRNKVRTSQLTSNEVSTPNQSPKPSTSQSAKKKNVRTPAKSESEKEVAKFEDYWDVNNVKNGLEDGSLVKGVLRINPKFYTESYVSQVDKTLQDYCISSIADRNRALEGDIVVLKIKPKSEWKENQIKAQVVYIEEKVHTRIAIGFITFDNKKKYAVFQPRDKRFPFLRVQTKNLPETLVKSPEKFKSHLFMARLVDWKEPKNAEGEIVENIGQAGDLKSETFGILLENSINIEPFSEEMQKYLPKNTDIQPKDMENREDFRKECIFTIDPLTAKDLDDAVSCKRLPNGNFEVGVHIADVSHYLHENTPLDDIVCKKATSIYFVEKVYHMLPVDLCMQCSLLPGRDSLAFSVIWELNNEAEIVATRFTRSAINSCTKFAYEHAQYVIEHPDEVYDSQKFPAIHNEYTLQDVCSCIADLQSLALHLRRRRLENGALRIDQVKVGFNLDSAGNPVSFFIQENKEANRLIEEFMLLANISVAKQIYAHYPEIAFLRCHVDPNVRLLSDLKNSLEFIGIHINIDSSGELNSSINKYKTDDYLGYTRFIALNHLLAKPMVRAEYFCAQNSNPATFHHYALSIPIYTHFTSPIRRYPDIMVHRLLAASLGYTQKPSWLPENVAEIARNCNKKKFDAKKAGEASCELYLAHYVEVNKPFITDAVVVSVQEKSFDVIAIRTGTTVRIYTNNFEMGVRYTVSSSGSNDKKFWKMNVIFPQTVTLPLVIQVIEIFQIVQISLQRKDKSNKLEAFLVRPTKIDRYIL